MNKSTVFSEIAWTGINCPNCKQGESLEVIVLLPDIPSSYNQYCPFCQCLFSDEHSMFLMPPYVEQD